MRKKAASTTCSTGVDFGKCGHDKDKSLHKAFVGKLRGNGRRTRSPLEVFFLFLYAKQKQIQKDMLKQIVFFCFTSLMAEKTLDDSECGIKYVMAKLSAMVKLKDLDVYERLKEQELHPQYYSFRWLTLLLSQEFPLPDVFRIWDSVQLNK